MLSGRADILTALVLVLVPVLVDFNAHALPASVPAGGGYDPEEAAGKVEGDMLLTEAQVQRLNGALQGRNGLIAESRRWPDRVVYYKIGGDFDAIHRNAIQAAIATLESQTCLKFRAADATQRYYVNITAEPGGCYTAVGYLAKVQQMNLEKYPIGEGCFRPGTVLHEFMHALGFYHQQSAADRDAYVDVLYENIIPGKEFNFNKYASSVVTDFDIGYDYGSCLHYRADAFSVNGADTMVPRDPQAKIGQRVGLSKKDIDKINVMYKCPIKI